MSHWSETSDRFWRHHLLLHCLFPSLPSPSLSSTMGVALQQDMWLVQRTVCVCVHVLRWPDEVMMMMMQWVQNICLFFLFFFSCHYLHLWCHCPASGSWLRECVCVSHPGRMWFLLNICSGADITSCFYVSEVLVKHFNWITSQTSRWLVSLVDLWVS